MANPPVIFTFQNGLQEVDGVVSPDYGSAANTITQGDDDRLSVQDLLRVKKNPGAGEYLTIESALAVAVSGQGITIGPGVYAENPLVVGAGITIKADANATVIVEPIDPGTDLFTLGSNSRLQGFIIRNVTGAAGVKTTNTASPCVLDFLTITNCDEHIVTESDATAARCTMVLIRHISGPATRVFNRVESISGLDAVVRVYSALGTDDDGTAFESGIYLTGPGARIDANNYLLRSTTGVGNGVRTGDGGEFVSQTGAEVEGFDVNIWTENVGDAPVLRTTTIMLRSSVTYDLLIEHPDTMGSIQIKANIDKVTIDDSAPIKLFLTDPIAAHETGIFVKGDILQADVFSKRANLSKLLRSGTVVGLLDGGALSSGGGLTIHVEAGDGFIEAGDGSLQEVFWGDTDLLLSAETTNYITVDATGLVQAEASVSDNTQRIILGRVVTNSSALRIIESSSLSMHHYGNLVETFLRRAVGPVYDYGSIVTESGTRNLDVTAGGYFFGTKAYLPSGDTGISWNAFYRDGIGGHTEVSGQSTVDNSQWDDGSGTLASLTAGFYAKHTLYLVGDGADEKYFLVFSQAQYATLSLAQSATLPTPPTFLEDAVTLIATVIVQQGLSSIAEIQDARPTVQFKATGLTASSDHGGLTGLGDNDHNQYLLRDGTNVMTADLDMGTHAITNVGLVDGVDVSAHASRHLPNGADPIATDAAVELTDSSNAEGNANTLARSNHTHAHGNRGGGALHAAATTSVNGFMSSTDKTKLDGVATGATANSSDATLLARANHTGTQLAATISDFSAAVLALSPPNARTITAGAGLTGGGDLSSNRTIDVAANADGSITVNANDIQVGILATDAQHGVRGGGTQHAAATTSVAGFMSAADKTKLDTFLSTKEKFYSVETSTNSVAGEFRARNVITSAAFRFNFMAPNDLVTVVSVEVIGVSNVTNATANIDITSSFGAVGETPTTNTDSDTASTYSLTNGQIFALDITAAFTALAAGDFAGFTVQHNTIGGNVDYLGVRLRYT